MADFGARRRAEQQAEIRRPAVPRSGGNWASTTFMDLALEGADHGRVTRGRDYFRAGHVLYVAWSTDHLVGWVKGSQLEPFEVVMTFNPMDEDTKDAVATLLGSSPKVLHEYMVGRPPSILTTPLLSAIAGCYCDCPDRMPVCKHIVAVAMRFARELEESPLELLHLRGIDPQPFKDALASGEALWGPSGGPSKPRLLDDPQPEQMVDPRAFWGRGSTAVSWDPPDVEEGMELGEREHLMAALESVTWTHIDQLDASYQIDRCYETLENAEPLFDYSARMSEVYEINDPDKEERDDS
ncbi:hypothetical protein GC425_02250 [Corynebacterium sp. zg254]|uniref:SWIM-type domain-containing protein n=1 Tax=Corynebacterium zhongnanshanii TaxID=2768834 RepID=A0ABQ6VFW8_9CORY|nr:MULTISPECIES: SWIM zinc finger family protein [Corynebacterium]KAB3523198.1 hypothetical protein F8377_03375 [Corynebacterium zhongnanshanii]MCR5913691.1 hypothetical protein [Corynebacterium sp. zg254]